MITVNGDWFALETANTGYYLGMRGGLVLHARVVACVEVVDHRGDELLCVGILPVFGLVGVADEQDAVGDEVGVEGGEVGPLVVGRVDQVVVVEPRCGGLLLTRSGCNAQESNRKDSENSNAHDILIFMVC